jgi:hypothetical protein
MEAMKLGWTGMELKGQKRRTSGAKARRFLNIHDPLTTKQGRPVETE